MDATLLKTISDNAKIIDANREFPTRNLKALGETGILGLLVPSEHGGMDASASVFAETLKDVGKSCASTGMVLLMHCCAIETIAKFQRGNEQILKAAAKGAHLSTLACSESGSGANFYASDATSEVADGAFILNGTKAFVTSGGHADSYVVSTRSVESKSSIDTSIYFLDKATAGANFKGEWLGVGLRGNSSIALELSKCKLSSSSLLGT